MTHDIPTGIIVVLYPDDQEASKAYRYLEEAKTFGELYYRAAAMVWRADDGKLHIKEPEDKTASAGLGVGAVLGGLIGTLAGPAGVVIGAGAGALFGGLAAMGDAGIPDKRLKEIGETLTAGSSALVVLLDEADLKGTQEQLAKQGGKVMATSVDADIAAQLVAGTANDMDNPKQEN